MEVLKERTEQGYGLKIFLVRKDDKTKVMASKIESFGEKRLNAPLDVHIAVTNKCNMNCTYCYAMDESFSKQEDMSFSEIINLLDLCSESNVFKISWSGGEPLLREKFSDILAYANELGFSQSIISNALAIDNKWIKIFKEYDIKVQLSLHDYDNASFWEKCSRLVENGVKVLLDVVMDEELVGKVDYIRKRTYESGIKTIKFGPIIPIGKAANLINLSEYKKLLVNLLCEIEKNKDKGVNFITQFDRAKVNDASLKFLSREDLLCEGGRTLLYIDNNGDAYPCPLLKSYPELNCGNVKNDTIFQIWNSNKIKEYQLLCSKIEGCSEKSCMCGAACRGLTMAYTGKLNVKSPFCGLKTKLI